MLSEDMSAEASRWARLVERGNTDQAQASQLRKGGHGWDHRADSVRSVVRVRSCSRQGGKASRARWDRDAGSALSAFGSQTRKHTSSRDTHPVTPRPSQ